MRDNPKRILVPTDFSPASNRALSLANGIASYAEESNQDLMAIATQGLSGLSRALLGLVADRVVRPVLTVRGSSQGLSTGVFVVQTHQPRIE